MENKKGKRNKKKKKKGNFKNGKQWSFHGFKRHD